MIAKIKIVLLGCICVTYPRVSRKMHYFSSSTVSYFNWCFKFLTVVLLIVLNSIYIILSFLYCQERECTTEEAKDSKADLEDNELRLDKTRITLIGFSKGCVVLNQFLYEFHYLKTLLPEDDTISKMVNRITDIYWLDGGHSGGKNTWVNSRNLLETLSRLSM